MGKRNIAKIFYAIFFLASLFFSAYILAEYRHSAFAVAASGLILLIAGYILFNEMEREKEEAAVARKEELERVLTKIDELAYVGKKIHTIMKNEGFAADGLSSAMEEADPNALAWQMQKILEAQERSIETAQKTAEAQINAMKIAARYEKENARQLAVNINETADRITEGFKEIAASLTQGRE